MMKLLDLWLPKRMGFGLRAFAPFTSLFALAFKRLPCRIIYLCMFIQHLRIIDNCYHLIIIRIYTLYRRIPSSADRERCVT